MREDGGKEEINFADQSGIYALYDAGHRCIYVGQAGRGEQSCLYDRLLVHACEDELFCFWKRFTSFGFYSETHLSKGEFADPITEAVSLEQALNAFESVATYLALPRFNRSSKSTAGSSTWRRSSGYRRFSPRERPWRRAASCRMVRVRRHYGIGSPTI